MLVDGQKIGDIGGATKVAMVDGSGSPMAAVSGLTGADAFTVTWVSSGVGGMNQNVTGQVSSGWPQIGGGSGDCGSGAGGSGNTGGGWGYPGRGYTGWGLDRSE